MLVHTCAVKTTRAIQHINAVTFAVRDMARSIEFYEKLGFELLYGGDRAGFSSLKAGEAFVNLVASSEYEHRWWGRDIFRVDDVDGQYRVLREKGLEISRRKMHLGVSVSFMSLIRTDMSLASQSCCQREHDSANRHASASLRNASADPNPLQPANSRH